MLNSLINPSKPDNYEYHDGILTNVYRWNIVLQPNEIASIKYKIKPDHLGEYGIKPTTVIDTLNNKYYSSNAIQFNVLCNKNNICGENENSLNCPEDCKTGLKDNICDYKIDDVCDPDCTQDPDCKLTGKSSLYFILVIFALIIIISLIYFFVNKNK